MDADGDLSARAIQLAIARREFQVVYQPIVHLDTGAIAGVEALCRFRDRRSPVRWFRASEAFGMAAELDLAIIESALSDLPRLPPGYLSLNLSPSTLLESRLPGLLRAAGVPGERLVVEITEHARVANYGRAKKTLDGLRAEGVHLAVDDAGAGYASFRHVLRLRPDIIKMDQSITQRINEDPARMALATAMVIFAGEIGAVVIGEGAETASELTGLQTAGVSRAQGFALARPQSLPLALPAGGFGARGRVAAATPADAAWAHPNNAAISAHELLNPVGSIELALELLRRKTEAIGEDECTALIGTAQRQARLVGGALQALARGLGGDSVIVLDELARTVSGVSEPSEA